MNGSLLALAIFVVLAIQISSINCDNKKQLQIGIKKRAENCVTKSKKGDILHMHYTGKPQKTKIHYGLIHKYFILKVNWKMELYLTHQWNETSHLHLLLALVKVYI
jgi:hypothetical protein